MSASATRGTLKVDVSRIGVSISPSSFTWVEPASWPKALPTKTAPGTFSRNKLRGCGRIGIAFGDLFLTDIRAYREKQLENSGLQPIFPVWGMVTRELARSVINSGVRAKLTCVDCKCLPPEFVGREFDDQLLSELPPEIDPCGENGEFHTFVYAKAHCFNRQGVGSNKDGDISAMYFLNRLA